MDVREDAGLSSDYKLKLNSYDLGVDIELADAIQRIRFEQAVRGVLEEGIAAGLFADADPKLLSFAILGAVNWIPRWFNPEGPASSQQIADRFADYLVAGLRVR